MTRTICILVLMLLAGAAAAAEPAAPPQAPPPTSQAPPPTSQKVEMNDLEKQFEKTMTGATLVGRFAVDGKEDQQPKEDRYTISSVRKIGQDLWLFTARVGEHGLPIPLPVPVKWAGETPVISVTRLTVPTRGTFTARVVIYGDRYAGTWEASDHGGELWGRIEHAGSATTKRSEKR